MRTLPAALLLVAGFVLVSGLVWAGCGAFLKNNDAYDRGLRAALADPLVHDVLGEPVYESWFLNGSIEGGGGTSRGTWLVRVKGAERSGTLTIDGFKTAGEWRVLRMALRVDGRHYTFQPSEGFAPVRSGDPRLGPPDILGGAE